MSSYKIYAILILNMTYDAIIIGAGAAGLMCAIEAGKRGRSVLVLDHNKKVGEKIRISGGGRCNFTNIHAGAENYISQNPHFCKSALAQYTPKDFLGLMDRHGITYHEKKFGQLFCNESSEKIIQMLLDDCRKADVEIITNCDIHRVEKEKIFKLTANSQSLSASSLVIATGGLSVPKLGATNFGHRIAEQFGLSVITPKPGLVPLKFSSKDFKDFKNLSGISVDVEVKGNGATFHENILITHRGLSGPAILQISSYWNPGNMLSVNLLPNIDVLQTFKADHQSKKQLATILDKFIPSRFVQAWLKSHGGSKPMYQYTLSDLQALSNSLGHWQIVPTGTEGYKKAEVTVGGIDTNELSSKTMEAKKVPGLYFIGEVIDVTGWLGGYNFQWAWSSGWVAGKMA